MTVEYKVEALRSKGFAAVIFDLDGVIVDSEPNHFQAYRQALRPHEVTLDYGYFIRRMIGKSPPESLARVGSDFGVAFDIAAVASDVSSRYRSLARESPRENLRIIDLVRRLKGRVITALGSGSSRENINCILDTLDLGHTFEVVVSGDDVLRGKPDPAIFLLAAKRASVSPRLCAVFEDSAPGIEAARSAGMYAIAIRTEYSAETDFRDADMVISDIKSLEVEKWVEFLVDGRSADPWSPGSMTKK